MTDYVGDYHRRHDGLVAFGSPIPLDKTYIEFIHSMIMRTS